MEKQKNVELLAAKETFYYRGAFADAKRAVDFVANRLKIGSKSAQKR
jgi:cephalosporin-C deacetylase-like acetyl esterase